LLFAPVVCTYLRARNFICGTSDKDEGNNKILDPRQGNSRELQLPHSRYLLKLLMVSAKRYLPHGCIVLQICVLLPLLVLQLLGRQIGSFSLSFQFPNWNLSWRHVFSIIQALGLRKLFLSHSRGPANTSTSMFQPRMLFPSPL
jgi:hypothetical protein